MNATDIVPFGILYRCELAGGFSSDGMVILFRSAKNADAWRLLTTSVAMSDDGGGLRLS